MLIVAFKWSDHIIYLQILLKQKEDVINDYSRIIDINQDYII